MISTAICGNSLTSWKKSSLEMRSVVTSLEARTVAVRGTSHRMAISPMMSFLPTEATVSGPSGVWTMISAEPATMM